MAQRVWNQLALFGLWATALTEAAEEGAKRLPPLDARVHPILTSELWAFLPLALISATSVAMVVGRLRRSPLPSDRSQRMREPLNKQNQTCV